MSGKGSKPRPLGVPKDQFDNNFESIFGKRVPTYMKKMLPDESVEQNKEDKSKEEGKE